MICVDVDWWFFFEKIKKVCWFVFCVYGYVVEKEDDFWGIGDLNRVFFMYIWMEKNKKWMMIII